MWRGVGSKTRVLSLWPRYISETSLSGYWLPVLVTTRCSLLTPRCRVLLEQLTGLQLVKKFPAFHGTRMFITTLSSVRHLSLSWASPIQSIYPHSISCRSFLILSIHLRLGLPSGLFPSSFPTKTLYLLTPWCTVLPEQLTGLQLVKKFPRHFTEPEGSLPHLPTYLPT